MNAGIIYIIYMLVAVFISFLLHETIHYMFAKIFKKENVKIVLTWKTVSIEYDNDKKYIGMLVIAVAPAIILFTLGVALFSMSNMFFFVLALFFICHIVFVLPFFSDGKVILYCLAELTKRWFMKK